MMSPGKRIQRQVMIQVDEDQDTEVTNIEDLCHAFGITKKDLVGPIKNVLFQGQLFPDAYKNSYDANTILQGELQKVVGKLVESSNVR